MVRCDECKRENRTWRYADPYETGLRSRSGGYPILSGFVTPTETDCNACGDTVRVSGWLEKDPHI